MAKILLAEDDSDLRMAYVFALTKAGHQVVEAADGAEAMAKFEADQPDLVILDMLMPGMSGLDFLRQTQLTTRFPNIKVIGFSNIEAPKVMEEAKKLGVAQYILKVDTTPKQVVDLVQEYLSAQNNQQ